MAKKIAGTPKSRIPLSSLAPRQACQTQQSSTLSIRGSEFDLVPEDIFSRQFHGKTFKECGLTEVTIDRPVGGPLTGVLMYAENWNTPLGCWRLSYTEAMNAIKTTDVTNSEEAIVPQEVFHSFATSASSLRAASTAMPKAMVATGGGVSSKSLAALADAVGDEAALAAQDQSYPSAKRARCSNMKQLIPNGFFSQLARRGGERRCR